LASFTHVYSSAATNSVSLTVSGPVGTNTLSQNNYIVVTNLASEIVITAIRKSGSDVFLSFTTKPGESYRVEYTDNLLLPWNIAVDSVPGTGNVQSVTHTGGGNGTTR